MSIQVQIEHEGKNYFAEIMTIKSTKLGEEDHGIFTANLHCSTISVGGMAMDKWDEKRGRRVGTVYGMELITAIMKTVGVHKWEDLPGERIFVLFEEKNHIGTMAVGIANIDTGDALLFQEVAQEWVGYRQQVWGELDLINFLEFLDGERIATAWRDKDETHQDVAREYLEKKAKQ